MSKLVNQSELVMGQRYWLDDIKDVSGVYIGTCSENGSVLFNDAAGDGAGKYIPRDDKVTLGFRPLQEFTWETYES